MIMRYAKGFSLIELMVVLIIMAIGLSIVAPSVGKILSQQKVADEMRTLQSLVRQASAKAFAQHQDIELKLSGHTMTLNTVTLSKPKRIDSEPKGYQPDTFSNTMTSENVGEAGELKANNVFEFEALTFPPTTLVAHKTGVLSVNEISVVIGQAGQQNQLSLYGVQRENN